MEAMATPRNIYQRINEVRKLCPFIRKDKRVEAGGNYMAVTHDHVTAELRDHLISQGIVIVPRLVNGAVVDTGTVTKGGIPILRYQALYEVDFINMDDPTDRVTVPLEAHANDSGDKAPGKATSYATKYAMLKLFSIETGETEEDRTPQVRAGRTPNERVANQVVAANVTPTSALRDQLSIEQLAKVDRIASEVIDCFTADQAEVGFDVISEANLDTDEKAALWTYFDSKMRSALKKIGKERQMKQLEASQA